ncbi:DUF3868 domain-containing protein [Bacteroides sp.]|uniref:DUF3868 domain-containing protein n=1 Tax=Bacteroides sp. TaxID=29523 RepID=UPI0023C66370|nr:DUF3868 domain-containing protein [Bacteroides sp.]MDE6216111.1 DUF3868 domain-containing protein [Bacteroides sp.]
MKRMIFILTALIGLGCVSGTMAQDIKSIVPGVSITHFKMERNGKYLTTEMIVDLAALDVESNRAVLLTPRLVNGTDSCDLPAIGVYGRRRYYHYVRNGMGSISGADETTLRASQKPKLISYNNSIDYKKWMDGATLTLHRSDWGCCQEIQAEHEGRFGTYHEAFFPELAFAHPKVEKGPKSRSLSGSAFIDFPVDKTVIYPEYRRNTVELGKIKATIDSVRYDKDVSINSVWLKGYASPESPYAHNRDLAIGRTQALKDHIQQLYHFDSNTISTDYEPEDWQGLRLFVEKSNINHRTEILAMIDSNLEPDAKEAKIKSTYPEEYRFLLQHCYPALRHTDYRIDYTIRGYNDVEEIKRIMRERPQNLSLEEFYLLASTYEPGTEEFTAVFETAVHLYPNDEIANLNAANAAIRQDNYEAAHRYLDKAGYSAEAVYARAALAIRENNYKMAVRYLEQARGMGFEKAAVILAEMKERGYVE